MSFRSRPAPARASKSNVRRAAVLPLKNLGAPATRHLVEALSIEMVDRLRKVKPEDLTENSVLIGSPAQITDTLKKVEAAGFSEVILYFNVGLKPHAQVKEEMARFMTEVAPHFEKLPARS